MPQQAQQGGCVARILAVQPGGIDRLRRLVLFCRRFDRQVAAVKAVDEEDAQVVQHRRGLRTGDERARGSEGLWSCSGRQRLGGSGGGSGGGKAAPVPAIAHLGTSRFQGCQQAGQVVGLLAGLRHKLLRQRRQAGRRWPLGTPLFRDRHANCLQHPRLQESAARLRSRHCFAKGRLAAPFCCYGCYICASDLQIGMLHACRLPAPAAAAAAATSCCDREPLTKHSPQLQSTPD